MFSSSPPQNKKIYDFEKNYYNEKDLSYKLGIVSHKTPGIF